MLPSKLMNAGQPEKAKYVGFFSENDQIRLLKSGSVSVSSSSSKVFQEDHETWEKGILDPTSEVMITWNKIFFFTCLLTLAIDPFFFYTTSVSVVHDDIACVQLDRTLGIVVTFFRSIGDLFHFLRILVKFRTAYVAPSSRVVGRGELITNPKKIAVRYLRSDFSLDLAAALPLPQILIWIIIPAVKNSSANHYNTTLAMIILLQYIPRFYLIFPLSNQITRATGFVTKTAWAGAAYNLLLYLVASHIIGSLWYLLSLERHLSCWKSQCNMENKNLQNATRCHYNYLDCRFLGNKDRQLWAASTSVFSSCNVDNEDVKFEYGIFENALSKEIVSNNFVRKYLYSLWWGLQQLSSNGQALDTTTFMGETAFAILISIVGLILFAHLIGNMQTFLQSTTARVEQWRLKRRDTEEWMRHRQLPNDLRHRVRKFMQYKWLAARGVNEESILRALPPDLRREIQRHLCLDLVRRVPFFSQMDDQLLDAICERLSSSLSTEGTYIVCEGDPVTEMIFIIRGRLESSTTDGGRTGFFNSIALRPGEFCGEELLAWALVPNSSSNLPISTRTLRALTEVEAFVLRAEDLKFVSNQFRRMHSKKLQQTFRFHSHHWRTWATCVIQVSWRQFKRRKMAEQLSLPETFMDRSDAQRPVVSKPDEPDFSVEHYN